MTCSHSLRTNSALNYKYPIIGQVRDFHNHLWNVRDVRATKHGFNLLYGSPARRRAVVGPPLRLITTKELVAYWEANKTRHDGILFDLPAGRTTLKRARGRLGFHYYHDIASYWSDHVEDLETLSGEKLGIGTSHAKRLRDRARLALDT